jgi:hypothetical protein
MRRTLLSIALALSPLAAHAAGFGPREYVRDAGAPITITDSFAGCGPQRAFRLRIENGTGNRPRVSAATVTVNGVEVVSEPAFSQQVATIERTLRLGKENALAVRLAGKPGGFLRLHITPIDPCLELTITSPLPGATVAAGPLLVRGIVRGADDVGVTVGGVPAAVEGGTFAALVEVDPQVSELLAVATTAEGTQQEARQTLVVDSSAPRPIYVRASPAGGAAPLRVRFKMVSLLPFVGVSLRLSGVDPPDFEGSSLDDREFWYITPGIHRALITTVDSMQMPHTAELVLHVMDPSAAEARLRARWSSMKNALRQGDIGRAAEAVATTMRDRYRELLGNLTVPLSQIDEVLTDVRLIEIDEFQADCEMIRVDNGITMSHFVRFIRDVDGVWRISFF